MFTLKNRAIFVEIISELYDKFPDCITELKEMFLINFKQFNKKVVNLINNIIDEEEENKIEKESEDKIPDDYSSLKCEKNKKSQKSKKEEKVKNSNSKEKFIHKKRKRTSSNRSRK